MVVVVVVVVDVAGSTVVVVVNDVVGLPVVVIASVDVISSSVTLIKSGASLTTLFIVSVLLSKELVKSSKAVR